MSENIFKKTPMALALATAVTMLLSSNIQAGQIVTDAPEGEELKTAVSEANKQFGFGGWDISPSSNVTVNVVDAEDLVTVTGSFDQETGIYSDMVLGHSFESEITSTDGEVEEIRGLLHGKDYPVGEPSGIKVINGDTEAAKNGKPENCIMTSSYLETGYLGAGNKPVLCSSHFQSHKRFKINLQPTTVADTTSGLGKPVDISFNLVDGDASTQRYQVLQKINNYTGKRLNGYKIEVLDANGLQNDALTLSAGIGENPGDEGEENGDVWDVDQMANFSHGLWGPIDKHFDEDGFFDNTRVYYTPTVDAVNKNTISYTGEMLGGNYQKLFGNWLTAEWSPKGVFHDDDFNPETDATLKAFWGDPTNSGTNAWHKGNSDIWAVATEADLLTWSGDWYSEGEVEDVLNLGLNYIVNVGDNALIGSTFTIRITPSVDTDQVAPTFVADPAPAPSYDESEAIIIVDITPIPGDDTATDDTDTEEPIVASRAVVVEEPSALITVGVADNDLNENPLLEDTVEVVVTTDHGETEILTLRESGINTSRFIGYLDAYNDIDNVMDNDGKLNLNKNTNLKATYLDKKHGEQGEVTIVSELAIEVASLPAEPDTDTDRSWWAGSFDSFLMMLFGVLGVKGLIARRKLKAKNTK